MASEDNNQESSDKTEDLLMSSQPDLDYKENTCILQEKQETREN